MRAFEVEGIPIHQKKITMDNREFENEITGLQVAFDNLINANLTYSQRLILENLIEDFLDQVNG